VDALSPVERRSIETATCITPLDPGAVNVARDKDKSMKARTKSQARRNERDAARSHQRIAHELEGAAGGAVAGAAAGAIAGLVGVAAGAVLGGMAGATAETVLEREDVRSRARQRELDSEIGVTDGHLGAPNLEHPPARVGAYSAASSGAGPELHTPAEGPFSAAEGEPG
jgi:hypothetical protein